MCVCVCERERCKDVSTLVVTMGWLRSVGSIKL